METTRKRHHVSNALFTLTKSLPSLGAHTIPTQAQRTQAPRLSGWHFLLLDSQDCFQEKHGGKVSFYTCVASKLASWSVLVQHEHKNMHLSCTRSIHRKKTYKYNTCEQIWNNNRNIINGSKILFSSPLIYWWNISWCVEIYHTAGRETQAFPFSQFWTSSGNQSKILCFWSSPVILEC